VLGHEDVRVVAAAGLGVAVFEPGAAPADHHSMKASGDETQKDDRDHWGRSGRACRRFALQATALGLKHAIVNQPVEVAGLRRELAALVCLPGRCPDLVMRFGYGPTLPFSARRPVEAVLA